MRTDPEKFLLELAGQLTEIRSSVSTMGGRVSTLDEQDLAKKVGEVNERLGAITEVIAQMMAEPQEEEEEGVGTSPNWVGADQEQARLLWDWLVEWCQNTYWPLYARPNGVWKPCWFRHQRLRIQLTWLCANWHWGYEPKAPPTRAGEWHLRWWPEVEKIINKELAKCGPASDSNPSPVHEYPVPTPGELPPYTMDDFADDGILAFMEKDIGRRPKPKKDDDPED